MGVDILADLREPLAELGRRWAASPHRPRPTREVLLRWDRLLEDWVASDLPLILRDSRRRGTTVQCRGGRTVVFGDNTPANWALGLALDGIVPELCSFTRETVGKSIPMSFMNRAGFRRDLNRAGWKVCHMDSVSDRRRYLVEQEPDDVLAARFIRFMSPRNMFVVPKVISGAGELPELIAAVREFDALNVGAA